MTKQQMERTPSYNSGMRRAVYVVFFLSGAAALIYEISWSRQIGLFFGHTAHAASIVLASFFAGMTIGYVVAGRLAGRWPPLWGYGAAELLAASWAMAVPWVISLAGRPGFQSLLSSESASWTMASRSVFCFLLLLPSTAALGATWPFMAEFMSPVRRIHPGRVTFAYALNTAGAIMGVLLGTYVFLSYVGVVASSRLAAAVSAGCGILALAIARNSERIGVAPTRRARRGVKSQNEFQYRVWLSLAALSGFTTMGLQVAYVRMFALVFHNSSYTFGAVVAVFLAALALGAFWIARFHHDVEASELAQWVSGLGAGAVGLSIVTFIQATRLQFFDFGRTFVEHIAGALGLVFVVIMPPVCLLGMLLPICWKAAENTSMGAGRIVGRLTAINTLAAAIGSLGTSFLLLPQLGLWLTLGLLGIAAFIPALLLLVRHRRFARAAYAGLAVLAVVGLGVHVARDARTLPEGVSAEIVRSWESPYGWIDVVASTRPPRFLVLRENLHYQHGDTGPSRQREYRQAHIPLLLHPHPQQVLFLGLGTGLTAGPTLFHREVEQIDIVELIPDVVSAARLFDQQNYGILDSPRVTVHIDDARHWLQASDRQFDLIISDLFVPWQSQTGYLYTYEHYQEARKKLRQGGIFCQWIGLYQSGQREFEMIADTFASVFPETTLWWGRVSQGMIALVGSNEPLRLDGNRIEQRLALLPHADTVSREYDPYLESSTILFRLYVGSWSPAQDSVLNTDEHPRIEFQMPVTYRNHQLIRGDKLLSYFDERLSRLDSGNAQFEPADGQSLETQPTRYELQRSVMGRSSDQ